MFQVLRAIFYLPIKILFPTRIIGKKNKIKKGRVILCCNHQSNLDPPLIAVSFFRRFYYMAKKSLFKNKFLGWLLSKFGAYPVDRETIDIKAMKKTLDLLKNDKALCLFPQGTRLSDVEVSQLKDGAILFSLKTNSPILPCVFLKKPGLFRFNKFIIGEPIKLYEMEQFANKKINDDLIAIGKEILFEKMNNLMK